MIELCILSIPIYPIAAHIRVRDFEARLGSSHLHVRSLTIKHIEKDGYDKMIEPQRVYGFAWNQSD